MKRTVGVSLPAWYYNVVKEYDFSSTRNNTDIHYGLELKVDVFSTDMHKILQSEHQIFFSSLDSELFTPFFDEEIHASEGGLLGGCAGGDSLNCGVLFFDIDNDIIYFEYIKDLSKVQPR